MMLRYLAILPINQPFNFDIKDASLYLDSQKNDRFFDCQKSAWTSIDLLHNRFHGKLMGFSSLFLSPADELRSEPRPE